MLLSCYCINFERLKMDDKISKSCPNCCQLYFIKNQSSGLMGNLPLLLSCGHTICEKCIRSLLKVQEPIQCKICLHCFEIKAADSLMLACDPISNLYKMFPVNLQVLGELTLQLLNVCNNTAEPLEEYFIDLQGIMMDQGNTKVQCKECPYKTTKMCKQCDVPICETCFNKSHENFMIFKTHNLIKIASPQDNNNNCKIHDDKQLDYYCNDCSKPLCMDCFMIGSDKSCKEHDLKSASEINVIHMEELKKIQPQVDETFRRLTKTAVDIGQQLYNIDNGTGTPSEVTEIITTMVQHFSKLSAVVQKHKQETIEIANKVKHAEKESLLKAKEEVLDNLKKARSVMRMISDYADSNQFKQMNLTKLLEDAQKVAEAPWFLLKEEDKENPLKLKVNDDLLELISDYIHLEGNATSVYKLFTPGELEGVTIPPPPPVPVFPPQLPRDVRQIKNPNVPLPQPKHAREDREEKKDKEVQSSKPFNFYKKVPGFHSKAVSVSSLNSASSDCSKQSYKPEDTYQSGAPRSIPDTPAYKPKQQLVEGTQELVYVSHIVNPHDFFVQRASEQKLVKDILREYKDSGSEPKPLPGDVAEGDIMVYYSNAEKLWLRCRVLRVKKPRYTVYCFDFGNIETVAINNLRMLPRSKWNAIPPLAMHCSLANCVPINGEWTNEDSILFQNILDNKQVLIHVRRVILTKEETKLDCDVIKCEQKLNLAQAFVFHERARILNPRLKYPTINTIGDAPKIFTGNCDFPPKSVTDIYFTHIVNPDKFFVRKRQHQSDFYRLCEELNQEYESDYNCQKIFLPELGMACVVNTQSYQNENNSTRGKDCIWARCEVTEIAKHGKVRVLLVDSGQHLMVHWSSLRAIQSRFTTLRALATECHLAGVIPYNNKWSPASVALLKKYKNDVLEMKVEDNHSGSSIGVCLFDKNDEEYIICINDEMVDHKFALTHGIFNFTRNPENLIDQSLRYNSPSENPTQKYKPEKKVLRRENLEVKHIDEKDLVAKDKGPLRLEAKILNYISPSIIYLKLVHQQESFNEMFANIQKYYNENKTEGKTEWEVDEKCCTICIKSQTWRRARIRELDGDNAKVFYVDFGTEETVQTSALKVLAPEFASIGVAALSCHMSGVMPAIGDEWPSLTKEFLKELLDAYNRIFITKSGNFKDNSMPIEIWVHHVIQGGALEANKSEWRCLNQKIIEQGLGIPNKSEQLGIDQNDDKKEYKEGEEVLSFLNITGLVSEWLQQPMPQKPLLPKADTENDSGASTEIECDDTYDIDNEKIANSIYITEWLEAEPFTTTEFTASPTFVDNDGIIYLHDVTQEDTFDFIAVALNERYSDPDPKANYVKWTVGEPCIALYDYDHRFYRGKVMEVHQATSNCLVHYIDYGNEEICSFANMRKSIALHEIPIQAHKCILSRIQPAGVQWERQTLDYIHKLIVEKQCFVKVVGKTIDGITPIDMKYGKLWINDHLVDFELAKYVDGAKKPIRKGNKNNTMPISDNESNVEMNSGPDFIIEDENPELIAEDKSESSISLPDNDSFDLNKFEGKDWNDLIADDTDNHSITGRFVTFPQQSDDEFTCNITAIYDTKVFPLSVIHDAETNSIYEAMFEEIQKEGDKMLPLDGVYKNKACIAFFEEDKEWNRAMILEYSEIQNLIKVSYADYDNIELVPLHNVREITEEWLHLPPRTVYAKLHGVDVNPEADVMTIRNEFSEILLNKGPFHAKIMNPDEFIPIVELKDANNYLVSEKLVEKGVFVQV